MAVDVTGLQTTVRDLARRVAVTAGEDMRRQAEQAAAGLQMWDYGTTPRRRFDPHWVLNGAEVDGPDDPILANPNRWPPVSHYHPQDHVGCLCRLRRSPRTVTHRPGVAAGATVRRVLESRGPGSRATRVGGRTVTVTRTRAPRWWTDVVNPTNWVATVRRHFGRG